ncbi:MAG: hypothetical protein VX179_09830 [Pseudomonadota bacterium]|nr:hypothetical protein [Pseudomonadota bacterium]
MKQIRRMASILLLGLMAPLAAMAAGPVAKLSQLEGTVEFSRDGEGWEVLSRNKYLFPGHEVRTGADGSAKLSSQASGEIRDLGASTHLRVVEAGIEVLAGSGLGASGDAAGGFWQGVENKFATSQRYTTVRRSVKKAEDLPKIDTARKLVLTAEHPEVVWSNAGPEFSYVLRVGTERFSVAPTSTAEMIRFALPEMAPGEYEYEMLILLDGEEVYAPRRPGKLTWLAGPEADWVHTEVQARKADPNQNDVFALAEVYEGAGLLVPVMDLYRDFFQTYPEENEMRPLLIKAYHDLKLMDLKEKEAITFNTIEMERQL